jgi:hypothetical protein
MCGIDASMATDLLEVDDANLTGGDLREPTLEAQERLIVPENTVLGPKDRTLASAKPVVVPRSSARTVSRAAVALADAR